MADSRPLGCHSIRPWTLCVLPRVRRTFGYEFCTFLGSSSIFALSCAATKYRLCVCTGEARGCPERKNMKRGTIGYYRLYRRGTGGTRRGKTRKEVRLDTTDYTGDPEACFSPHSTGMFQPKACLSPYISVGTSMHFFRGSMPANQCTPCEQATTQRPHNTSEQLRSPAGAIAPRKL